MMPLTRRLFSSPSTMVSRPFSLLIMPWLDQHFYGLLGVGPLLEVLDDGVFPGPRLPVQEEPEDAGDGG